MQHELHLKKKKKTTQNAFLFYTTVLASVVCLLQPGLALLIRGKCGISWPSELSQLKVTGQEQRDER